MKKWRTYTSNQLHNLEANGILKVFWTFWSKLTGLIIFYFIIFNYYLIRFAFIHLKQFLPVKRVGVPPKSAESVREGDKRQGRDQY